MKTILIDPSRCVQCGNCMIVCHDEHYDNEWLPIAAAQGDSPCWMRLDLKEVASGRMVKQERTPIMCQHCEKCALEAIAPEAVYHRADGIVIIDPEKAEGRDDLVKACPYNAVYWNEEKSLPQKCTMCAHLLDEGWSKPRCVTACPADALMFVDVAELNERDVYAPIEELNPERDDNPLVRYVRLPKPFVGGDVVDLATGDPIQNVKVIAVHQVTGAAAFDCTDGFGGFKIDQLQPGFYTLHFECGSHAYKRIADLDLREAKFLGEVALVRL